MKEFREKNSINDGGLIFTVKTFQDMLNYIDIMKVNYIKYYDFIMCKFTNNNQISLIDISSRRRISSRLLTINIRQSSILLNLKLTNLWTTSSHL